MKKGLQVIILYICLIYTNSYSGGEISFRKQKQLIEKEKIEKLNKKEDVREDDEQEEFKLESKKEKIDISGRKKYKFNQKLIGYIKTQNPKLSEKMIIHILENVFRYSKEYDVNPILVLAVMNTESNFNHSIISGAGAKGLMQLMPFNFKEFGVDNSIEGNIRGGIMHLKRDYDKTKNVIKTLVCYNAGYGRLKNDGWKNIRETREYIPKVFEKYYTILNFSK